MSQTSRNNRRNIIVTAGFMLLAYSIRILTHIYYIPGITNDIFTLLRGAIYIGIVFAWGISVHRRILHTKIRRLFTAMSSLMIFWLVVRTVKFVWSATRPDMNRHLWYVYYIPMLWIPLIAFMISLWLSKPENYRPPRFFKLFYVVAALLMLLVLTNDFHQWVFGFPGGVKGSADYAAIYRPMFYVVLGWRLCGLVVTIGMIIAKSRVPQSKKWMAFPIVLSALLFLYGISYVTGWIEHIKYFEDVTVTECFCIIAILESCLRCRLIPSNTNYAELFRKMGYSGVITDIDGTPVHKSDVFGMISNGRIQAALQEDVLLEKGMVLKSMPISDGYILWTENIAELLELEKEASKLSKELLEEQELLQAEIEIKQKKAIFDTRNRLYDVVMHELSPQFAQIDSLVSHPHKEEEEKKQALRRMCVIGAYIKRSSNLLFIHENSSFVSSDELVYCLRESADYIRVYGAVCTLRVTGEEKISLECAKLFYDLFEQVVETVLETLAAMLVCLNVSNEEMVLNIQSECQAEEITAFEREAELRSRGGTITSEREENIDYVRISLPIERGQK